MDSGRSLRSRSKPETVHDISDSDSDVQEITPAPSASKRKPKKHRFTPEKRRKDADDVRAPIPQITGTLSEGDPFAVLERQHSNARIVDLRQQFKEAGARKGVKGQVGFYDGFRDYQRDTQAYMQTVVAGGSSSKDAVEKDIHELFRVPPEIVTHGTFDEVRHKAVSLKRWLFVSLHNYTEFPCMKVIRDCLRNEAVKEIIQENFVFWHTVFDSREGLRYKSHYQVTSFPHLAILDPRTGEKVQQFGELDALGFCNVVAEFLAEKPSFDPAGPLPDSKGSRHSLARQSSDSVVIIDEEEELEKAVKLSQAEELRKKLEPDTDEILEGFLTDDEDSPKSPKASTSKAVAAPSKPEEPAQSWKDYLGDPEDSEVALKIRLPSGTTLDLSLPSSSAVKAVWLYVASQGFAVDKYDIFTSFPRKSVTDLEEDIKLKDAGFAAREMLTVQSRHD